MQKGELHIIIGLSSYGLTKLDLSNIVNSDIQRIIDELILAENIEKLKTIGDRI